MVGVNCEKFNEKLLELESIVNLERKGEELWDKAKGV